MDNKILSKAKETLASTKVKLSDLKENFFDDAKKEIVEQFKDSGQEKIQEVLTTFSQYSSLYKEAGFELSSINASVSLPPDVSVTFKCLNAITIDKREELLEKSKENKIAIIILMSLFKASDFAESIRMGDYKLKSINIKLGLIPGISVSFS